MAGKINRPCDTNDEKNEILEVGDLTSAPLCGKLISISFRIGDVIRAHLIGDRDIYGGGLLMVKN